jgi:hypothetical protein
VVILRAWSVERGARKEIIEDLGFGFVVFAFAGCARVPGKTVRPDPDLAAHFVGGAERDVPGEQDEALFNQGKDVVFVVAGKVQAGNVDGGKDGARRIVED